MQLFDTHFHYDGALSPQSYFDSIKTPELAFLLAVGGDLDSSYTAQNFANNIPNSWFAAGVHPHSACESQGELEKFKEFATDKKLVAVGEIGLDYFYNNAPQKLQRDTMEYFLELALELKLPAIIHCRDKDDNFAAYKDCYAMLKSFATSGGKFVVHCFSGSPEWAEKFMEIDAYLGITGIVTFPRAVNIRETLKVIKLDRLLLETDSPYLAPVPYRGKVNNPGYIIEVAKRVAKERNLPLEELVKITTTNAARLFSLTSVLI